MGWTGLLGQASWLALALISCQSILCSADEPFVVPLKAKGSVGFPIEFHSQGATMMHDGGVSSGPLKLTGTFYLPAGVTALQPVNLSAVLLIGGFENSNQFECIDNKNGRHAICAFYDIASDIVNTGSAVMVYNKRTCPYYSDPDSNTTVYPCPVPERLWCASTCDQYVNDTDAFQRCRQHSAAPSSQDCSDISKTSYNDLVADASSALEFLMNKIEVSASQISVLGHGQGADIAPMAASIVNNINPEFEAQAVISFNGAGVPVNETIPIQKALSTALGLLTPEQRQDPSTNLSMVEAEVDSKLEELHITPADWVTLMHNPPSARATILNLPYVCSYWQDWILSGVERSKYIKQSRIRNFFALNSPADVSTPPQIFEPLHTLLRNIVLGNYSSQALGGALSYPHDTENKLNVQTAIVYGIKHQGDSIVSNECGITKKPPAGLLRDKSVLLNVCPKVLNAISGFINDMKVPLPPAPPTPLPSADPPVLLYVLVAIAVIAVILA